MFAQWVPDVSYSPTRRFFAKKDRPPNFDFYGVQNRAQGQTSTCGSQEEARLRSACIPSDHRRGQEICVFRQKQGIFAQGDTADAVFYI